MNMRFLLNALIIIVLIAVTACGGNVSKISRPLLGTVVTITVAADPGNTAEAFDAAFKEIENVQKHFNPNDPQSDVSKINKTASISPCKAGDDVFQLIARSIEISENCDGAFDITFASAGKLWDFSKEKFTPPDDKLIQKMIPLVSYKNLRLDRGGKSIRFLKSGTKIGLGGIAKGYATGRAVSVLRKLKVKGAIVACAGDIQVIGSNNGKPWRTGIQDPRGNSVIAAIDMHDGEAVSTSGDYERFRIVNGKRYHHIIDPSTGYPADSGLISVSVFSNDPVLSDGYSTAFFVSGLDKTKRILATMPGLSVVLVSSDMKVYVSKSLKGRISFRDDLEIIYFAN